MKKLNQIKSNQNADNLTIIIKNQKTKSGFFFWIFDLEK